MPTGARASPPGTVAATMPGGGDNVTQAQARTTDTTQDRYDGTDYVCDNCGCEIMVKHRGDASKISRGST